jgi:NTE family protein
MTAAARKRADLVLSGGGIKGVALVGAVGALIDASGLTMSRIGRDTGVSKLCVGVTVSANGPL